MATQIDIAPGHEENLHKLKNIKKRNPGHADNLHKLTIARLDSGDAAILVIANGARTFTLKVCNNKKKYLFFSAFLFFK